MCHHRRFPTHLGTCRQHLLSAVLLMEAGSCTIQCPVDDLVDGPGTDAKSFVNDAGRPGGGVSSPMDIADTGYTAYAYPAKFSDEANDDFDYFVISVQRPRGRTSRVLYERKLRMDMVAPGKVQAAVSEMVSYEAATRTVRFDLGNTKFEYVLP